MIQAGFADETTNTESMIEECTLTNMEELEYIEDMIPMTPGEKRAIRNWVKKGGSIYEYPSSYYVNMIDFTAPHYNFLEAYRLEKEIRADLQGKTRAEREAYFKEYTGWEEPTPEELLEEEKERSEHAKTPEAVKEYIRRLEREVFYLNVFVGQEGLYEEAQEFLKEHKDEPIPFEFY